MKRTGSSERWLTVERTERIRLWFHGARAMPSTPCYLVGGFVDMPPRVIRRGVPRFRRPLDQGRPPIALTELSPHHVRRSDY